MGDETYLEAFVENLGSLPQEVRRNLDWMKDLDTSCSALVEELRQAEHEYLRQAEEKMLRLRPGTCADGRPGVAVLGGDSSMVVVVPTTEELTSHVRNVEAHERIVRLRQNAMQVADEKVAIANQTCSLVDATLQRLDGDLAKLESELKASGAFETSRGGAKPDDLAAIQVNPASPDWILAKVLSHDAETGIFSLADEDVESQKVFHLPESQVVVLGALEKLSRGDVVFAVYPDTTSFYQATVVQAPRKAASAGGSFVMVNFVDDSDEHGVTHDKAIPLQHVMRPPYGVTLQ